MKLATKLREEIGVALRKSQEEVELVAVACLPLVPEL